MVVRTVQNYAILAVVLLTVGFPRGAAAEPRTYRLDPEHMCIGFLVRHLSFADVLGVFQEAEGTIIFDEEAPALHSVEIGVNTQSVDTRHERRDDHLRSGDFLAAGDHPEMRFVMTGTEQSGERTGRVTDDLTIIGRTRPITLDVTWNDSGAYPFGDRHYAVGISARGTLLRSEWGMDYGIADALVGDEVEIIIEAEFIREE